jgi:hypothetical protein
MELVRRGSGRETNETKETQMKKPAVLEPVLVLLTTDDGEVSNPEIARRAAVELCGRQDAVAEPTDASGKGLWLVSFTPALLDQLRTRGYVDHYVGVLFQGRHAVRIQAEWL